ncbi:hypothetical protein [Streptomyces sp. NPDC048637]|uniref:hypothetical protein n=1 Tax=Streptomyces sp. NPDC048637 TaxID=3155636 RepID=UPI0034241561
MEEERTEEEGMEGEGTEEERAEGEGAEEERAEEVMPGTMNSLETQQPWRLPSCR